MPPAILAVVLEGLFISLGMAPLSLHAYRTNKYTMYPPSDPEAAEKEYPPDAMAILELNGMKPKHCTEESAADQKEEQDETMLTTTL